MRIGSGVGLGFVRVRCGWGVRALEADTLVRVFCSFPSYRISSYILNLSGSLVAPLAGDVVKIGKPYRIPSASRRATFSSVSPLHTY